MQLTSKKLMRLWREFWTKNQHTEIKGASLIPEDNTVLFTTAGMQPLVPYLMGKTHPLGNKLFDIQPCLRTNDIDEVGDNRHHTMFFMLGNWSLGAYFKPDAIKWSYQFLTDPNYLGIPKDRLAVTVFAGNDIAPRDEVASQLWQQQGMDKSQIYYLSDNWWEIGGGVGPCGPDTEIFYDTGKPKCCENCNPSCDCGKWVEIWNNVFMEFNVQKKGDKPERLPKQNVDTGMGLERVVSVLNGFSSTYQNDCFSDAVKVLEELSNQKFDFASDKGRDFCIICDHIRASVFLLGDAQPTTPSNVGQGYVLRRLIRRAVNCTRQLNIQPEALLKVADTFVNFYADEFPRFVEMREFILDELKKEIEKFAKALTGGLKEFKHIISGLNSGDTIDGASAFRLFDTFGFPLELTIDLSKEHNISVDKQGFDEAMQKHQQLSRDNSGAMFKGGVAVATNSDEALRLARLHSATHLMLGALRRVVGDYVEQRGSNITPERLRFDFLCDHKLTPDELSEVERQVNEAIKANVPITCQTMSPDEARASGAIGIFDNKYGDQVTVYTMGEFSKEICGGPHAKTTGELKLFKILKEESSSSGVRRIKATIFDN